LEQSITPETAAISLKSLQEGLYFLYFGNGWFSKKEKIKNHSSICS
jgi:hypothetical protein